MEDEGKNKPTLPGYVNIFHISGCIENRKQLCFVDVFPELRRLFQGPLGRGNWWSFEAVGMMKNGRMKHTWVMAPFCCIDRVKDDVISILLTLYTIDLYTLPSRNKSNGANKNHGLENVKVLGWGIG